MVLKSPMQFLLRCSDGEVVQDNITFRVGVILGFRNVLLCFAYKFNIPVCRVTRAGITGLGLVFKIRDDLKKSQREGGEMEVRSTKQHQKEIGPLSGGEDGGVPGRLLPELTKGSLRDHRLK